MDGWQVQDKNRLDYGTIKSSRCCCQSNHLDTEYRRKHNVELKNRVIN